MTLKFQRCSCSQQREIKCGFQDVSYPNIKFTLYFEFEWIRLFNLHLFFVPAHYIGINKGFPFKEIIFKNWECLITLSKVNMEASYPKFFQSLEEITTSVQKRRGGKKEKYLFLLKEFTGSQIRGIWKDVEFGGQIRVLNLEVSIQEWQLVMTWPYTNHTDSVCIGIPICTIVTITVSAMYLI